MSILVKSIGAVPGKACRFKQTFIAGLITLPRWTLNDIFKNKVLVITVNPNQGNGHILDCLGFMESNSSVQINGAHTLVSLNDTGDKRGRGLGIGQAKHHSYQQGNPGDDGNPPTL